MKKVLLSTVMCLALATTAFANGSVKIQKESKSKSVISKFFTCAGEIYILDSRGNKIKTILFSAPAASNQLDCLTRFSSAVAQVEEGLQSGQTTSGTVSYIK